MDDGSYLEARKGERARRARSLEESRGTLPFWFRREGCLVEITLRDVYIARVSNAMGRFALYSRHRLDITTRDLLHGFRALVAARRRRELERAILRVCSLEETGLVCCSVRSGFDLLLNALGLPAGSEVLVSAVTHPDMVRIIEQHGLRAIPVDLDPETLEPRRDSLERALSPRTRALLVAHLFGGRVDLASLSEFARKHHLLLLEDCAQAFRGPREMGGSSADVSMYSFGPIKTTTALGGAIFRVRDSLLRERMRRIQSGWPIQRRSAFLIRTANMLALMLIARPIPYRLLADVCRLAGQDLDALVGGAAHAFPSRGKFGAEITARFRLQPTAPLLVLLRRRLETFDGKRLARRAVVGERAACLLPDGVKQPGRCARARTHWLFPVIVPGPESLVRKLRSAGFDASRATSNIAAIPAPRDRPDLSPVRAERMMSGMVFLPVYPELPDGALRRMMEAMAETVRDGG